MQLFFMPLLCQVWYWPLGQSKSHWERGALMKSVDKINAISLPQVFFLNQMLILKLLSIHAMIEQIRKYHGYGSQVSHL